MAEENKWEKMAQNGEEQEVLGEESTDQLEDELNETEQALVEAKEQNLRLKAEMQNLRARSEREVQNAYKYAAKKLLEDLLPVMDSLTRGLEVKDAEALTLREGMELTLSMLEKTLEKHGVEAIAPEVGDVFDPERHEAMSMVPNPDAKSNTVTQVLQKGYLLNDRVVRAAMVIVAQ